jgi:hypothetical protein
MGDIGSWLFLGILMAGLISFLVPADFIQNHVEGRFVPLVMMLLVGIPLYICATASTPIAAALVLKGLSPGAALVFLLTGPATNASTISVVTRLMGKRITAIYILCIALCSLLLGLAVDQIYTSFGVSVAQWMESAQETGDGAMGWGASVLLVLLVLRNYLPGLRGRQTEGECCGTSRS